MTHTRQFQPDARFDKIARNQDRVLSGFYPTTEKSDRVLLDFIGFLSGQKSGFSRVFCRIFVGFPTIKNLKNLIKRRSKTYVEGIFLANNNFRVPFIVIFRFLYIFPLCIS